MLEYDVSQFFFRKEKKEVTIFFYCFLSSNKWWSHLDKVLIEIHGIVHFSVAAFLFQVYVDSKYLPLRFRTTDFSACWPVLTGVVQYEVCFEQPGNTEHALFLEKRILSRSDIREKEKPLPLNKRAINCKNYSCYWEYHLILVYYTTCMYINSYLKYRHFGATKKLWSKSRVKAPVVTSHLYFNCSLYMNNVSVSMQVILKWCNKNSDCSSLLFTELRLRKRTKPLYLFITRIFCIIVYKHMHNNRKKNIHFPRRNTI